MVLKKEPNLVLFLDIILICMWTISLKRFLYHLLLDMVGVTSFSFYKVLAESVLKKGNNIPYIKIHWKWF